MNIWRKQKPIADLYIYLLRDDILRIGEEPQQFSQEPIRFTQNITHCSSLLMMSRHPAMEYDGSQALPPELLFCWRLDLLALGRQTRRD